jgi:hypothetical protein
MLVDVEHSNLWASSELMLAADSATEAMEIPTHRISVDTGFSSYLSPDWGNHVPENSRDPSPASSSWSSTNSLLNFPFTPVHTPLMDFTALSESASSPQGVSLQFSIPGRAELAILIISHLTRKAAAVVHPAFGHLGWQDLLPG